MDIILASTSPYRRALLERLRLHFRCESPKIDEVRLPQEMPECMAKRLALSKAESVATANPSALVIGSDQVAVVDGSILGKPGGFNQAAKQLRDSSGRNACFYTAVALVCVDRAFLRFHVEPYNVKFRLLTETQIANYLALEEPYDCAGSFKVEGLGIALFESLNGNDPTSLEGLPLITLTKFLADAGVDILGSQAPKLMPDVAI
ncbi:MAG: Maf family nucleotide pyrophosphatase [Halioglobus sp.]